MVSFAPTSAETLEDQRLYTQARLTEVAENLAKKAAEDASADDTSGDTVGAPTAGGGV